MTETVIPYSVLLFVLSLVITVFSLSKIIPRLLSVAKQPIYEGGPSWHLSKSGTPTMGGIAFLLTFTLLTSLSLVIMPDREEALSLIILSVFSVLNGAIGIFDDVMKLRHKHNKGLSAKQKIILQSLLVILFLLLRALIFCDETAFELFGIRINLGIFYYPISFILILGAVNCANLTDGIDGLLSSVSLIASLILTLICIISASAYAPLCVLVMGIALGFLFYNVHPAKIFMGDTGSLFLGAFIISLLYSVKRPTIFFSVGSVFILEGISVILQVAFFKLKGKRLFIMSPLHHHLERLGYSENQICIMAIIMTLLLSFPQLIYEVMR